MELSEIATIAMESKKKNKNHIHDMIKQCITDDLAPTKTQWAELYKYFLPTIKKHNFKTPEELIVAHMAIKDVRYYLNYVYSDGEFLVTTDGHRMAWNKTKIPAGFYDSALVKCDTYATFPNWKSVIPEKTVSVETPDKIVCDGETKGTNYMTIGKSNYNIDYYKKATALDEPFTLSEGDEKLLITYKNGTQVIIMAMRGI